MPSLIVLVATDRHQGKPGDFFLTTAGELVYPALMCDSDRLRHDAGGCVCGRTFAGLTSGKGGTTAEVAQVDMTKQQYVDAHLASLIEAGWPDDADIAAWALEAAEDVLEIAAKFTIGTVVERRGNFIVERPRPAATQQVRQPSPGPADQR